MTPEELRRLRCSLAQAESRLDMNATVADNMTRHYAKLRGLEWLTDLVDGGFSRECDSLQASPDDPDVQDRAVLATLALIGMRYLEVEQCRAAVAEEGA